MIKKALFLALFSSVATINAETPWTQERLEKAAPIVIDDLPSIIFGQASFDVRDIQARAVLAVAYSSQYCTDGLSEAGNNTLAEHKKKLQQTTKKLVDDYWNNCGTAPECVKAWKNAEYWESRHLAEHAGGSHRPGAPRFAALGDQVAELFSEHAENKPTDAAQQ